MTKQLADVRRRLAGLDEYVQGPEAQAKMRALNAGAPRVSVPFPDWAGLGEPVEGWRAGLARHGVQVEDGRSEDEGVYAFFCEGLPAGQLLTVVRGLLPAGSTASVAPVPPLSVCGAEIAVTREQSRW